MSSDTSFKSPSYSILSVASFGSLLSAGAAASTLSLLSLLSFGSLLSVLSHSSVLSVMSSNSVMSIGCTGGYMQNCYLTQSSDMSTPASSQSMPTKVSVASVGYFPNVFNPVQVGSMQHFQNIDLELVPLNIFDTIKAVEQVNIGYPYKMIFIPLFFMQYYGLSSTAFGTPFDLQMGTLTSNMCVDLQLATDDGAECQGTWREAMKVNAGAPFLTASKYLNWWYTKGQALIADHMKIGGLDNVTTFVYAMDAPATALVSAVQLTQPSDFAKLTMRSVGTSNDIFKQAGASVRMSITGPQILGNILDGTINGFEHASISQDLYSIILAQNTTTNVYNDPDIEPFNAGHVIVNKEWYSSLPSAERGMFEQSLESYVYNSLQLSSQSNDAKISILERNSAYTVFPQFPTNIKQYLQSSWDTVLPAYGTIFQRWYTDIKSM